MRDRHLKYLLVAPAVFAVAAVSVWPLLESLRLSFHFWKLSRSSVPGGFVGTEHYQWALFEDPAFWNAAAITGIYTVLTVALSILCALALALLLAPGGRLRWTARTLLVLPFAMSPALVGVSFRFMFNPEFGLFDAFFGALFPPLADIAWLANPRLAFSVCVMADVWGWTPFLAMVLIGGLDGDTARNHGGRAGGRRLRVAHPARCHPAATRADFGGRDYFKGGVFA